MGKLRALAIVEAAVGGDAKQPSQKELDSLSGDIRKGVRWDQVFPGIATIDITATGVGPSLDLRITKKSGIPVVLVPEGTEGAYPVAVKRVDELGFYSMNTKQLADNVGLTMPKAVAVIRGLNLKADPESYKEFVLGKSRFSQYSQKAITRIQDALRDTPVEEFWVNYRSGR